MIGASSTNVFRSKKSTGVAQPTTVEIHAGLGTVLLPTYRIVSLVGAPGGDEMLGRGSRGTPNEAMQYLASELVPPYQIGKPVIPAFQLIATLVHRESYGGRYSTRLSDDQIQRYLTAVRDYGGILILDIQPGKSPWMDEVRAYTRWLKEPDVSLALDPEWSFGPDETPQSNVIGRISAADINEVSAYMQRVITENKLPQKLLVVHEFKDYQLTDQSQIVDRPGVKTVLNVDGVGSPAQKLATYVALTNPGRGKAFPMGFKLFFDDDTRDGSPLMTPDEVNGLVPQPDFITYE